MLNLNDLRHEMARYMIEHERGSLDSAIFHLVKIAYRQGYEDGITTRKEVEEWQQ